MSDIPLTYSDVQCGQCFEYFRFDGDLIDHREQIHGTTAPFASRVLVGEGEQPE